MTLVDNDERLLGRMHLEPGWEAVCADAFEWAGGQLTFRYDAVVLDPFTSLMDRVVDELPRFLRLARFDCVVGVVTTTRVPEFPGWQAVRKIRRSDKYGGVWWLVMERTWQ